MAADHKMLYKHIIIICTHINDTCVHKGSSLIHVSQIARIAPNTDQTTNKITICRCFTASNGLYAPVMTTVTHVQSINMMPKGHRVITETIFGEILSLSQCSGPLITPARTLILHLAGVPCEPSKLME